MLYYVDKLPNFIDIGEEAENIAVSVEFDYTAWVEKHGAGAAQLLIKRPQDTSPYPATTTAEDNVLTWLPTQTDTDFAGRGEIQILFSTADEILEKSHVLYIMTGRSLEGAGDPPEPYENWIDSLTDLASETLLNAQAAAASAEDAEAAKDEVVGELPNITWRLGEPVQIVGETTWEFTYDEEKQLYKHVGNVPNFNWGSEYDNYRNTHVYAVTWDGTRTVMPLWGCFEPVFDNGWNSRGPEFLGNTTLWGTRNPFNITVPYLLTQMYHTSYATEGGEHTFSIERIPVLFGSIYKSVQTYASNGAGNYSSVAGAETANASGYAATAIGAGASAEGDASTAVGCINRAKGGYAVAIGGFCDATGDYANAIGYTAEANGDYSTAFTRTKAASANQTTIGKFNVVDDQNTYAFIIGDGEDDSHRSNLLTVEWDGTVRTKGKAVALLEDIPTDADDIGAIPAPDTTGTAGQVLGLDSNLDPVWVNQTGGGDVTDVQVAGTSVVSDHVANIPYADTNTPGVIKVNADYGVALAGTSKFPYINAAVTGGIQPGSSAYRPIVPKYQHESVFYGLSKAAGVDLANETVSVGTYPTTAQTAIKGMLGVPEDAGDIPYDGTETYPADTVGSEISSVKSAFALSDMALKGKIVSILGDSISTYTGWIPVADGHNLAHRARYPGGTSFWTGTADDTWWKKLIDETGAVLGINDSWAGSKVSNSSSTDHDDVGPNACMAGLTRITNLGANGSPDVIFFYGGTNDCGTGVTPGTFDPTATYSIDLTTTIWNDFATAYKDAIMRLQYYYPDATIVVLLPTYTTSYYQMDDLDAFNEIIKEVCDYFGVDWIDLRRCGINWANVSETLGDGVHPTVDGFALMERYILARMSSLIRFEPGEQTVYTVTNTLGGSVNNNAYIKGVSAGKPYTATITGSFLGSVTVEMGGVDVTSTVYNASTGEISIAAVTGNVVINDHSGVITWYSDEISAPGSRNNSNKAGYGWAAAQYNPYPYNVPINAVRFMSSDSSGVFEVGVADQLNGTTITKVQSVSWTSANKDENNVVTIILPETFTITSPELLVISPNTLPTYSFKYLTGSGVTSAKYFYTRVPIVHPGGSGSAWTKASSANIFHDFGYVSE